MEWNKIFEYREGELYWKIKPAKRISKGSLASRPMHTGYKRVRYDNKPYYAHRVIYEMFFGPIPKNMEIDHIDRDRSNNNIDNLRIATKSQNKANRALTSRNSSGYKGVYWSKQKKKWHVQTSFGGERKHIGFFDDIEEAALAFEREFNSRFKEFAYTGRD